VTAPRTSFGYRRFYEDLDAASAFVAPSFAIEFTPPPDAVVAKVRTPAGALAEAQRARNNAKRTVEPHRSYHIALARWWVLHARSMNGAAIYQRIINRLTDELSSTDRAVEGFRAMGAVS
jgi:aminoglycoside N3'-acetyltransferase